MEFCLAFLSAELKTEAFKPVVDNVEDLVIDTRSYTASHITHGSSRRLTRLRLSPGPESFAPMLPIIGSRVLANETHGSTRRTILCTAHGAQLPS
jgi:hypothetical protein